MSSLKFNQLLKRISAIFYEKLAKWVMAIALDKK